MWSNRNDYIIFTDESSKKVFNARNSLHARLLVNHLNVIKAPMNDFYVWENDPAFVHLK